MRSRKDARRFSASTEHGLDAFSRAAAFGLVVLLILPSLGLAEEACDESEDQLLPAGDRVVLWELDRVPSGQAFGLDGAIAAGTAGTYLFGGTVGAAVGGLVLLAALLDDGYRSSPPSHRTLIEREIDDFQPRVLAAGLQYGSTAPAGSDGAFRLEYSVGVRYRPREDLSLKYNRKSRGHLQLRGAHETASFFLNLDARLRSTSAPTPPFAGAEYADERERSRVPLLAKMDLFTLREYSWSRHAMSLARAEDERVVIVGEPRPISYSLWRLHSLGLHAEQDWYRPGESFYGVDLGVISFHGGHAIERSRRISLCLRTDVSFLVGPANLITPDEDARAVGRASYPDWFSSRLSASPCVAVDLNVVRLRLESEGTWSFASPRLRLDEGDRVVAPTRRSDLLLRLGTTFRLSGALEVDTGIEAGRSGGRLSIHAWESGERGERLHVQERTVDRLVGFVRLRLPSAPTRDRLD